MVNYRTLAKQEKLCENTTGKEPLQKTSNRKTNRMNTQIFVCDLTHTYKTIALNCMPYPVACLVTYAASHLKGEDRFNFRIFKYPNKLIDALLQDIPPMVAFSNYMWNIDLSYSFAQRIKQKNPQTIIVFGGPNYPTNPAEQEQFLRKYPLVDFYVYKEGEVGFTALLEALTENGWDAEVAKNIALPGCHFIREGKAVIVPPAERVKNLDEIPSPYLTGVLDEFFEPHIVPMIQCNRGCPFTCTFCVEGLLYYNKVNRRGTETIERELRYIAERKHKTVHDLHIVDSNFGMYPEDEKIGDAIARIQNEFGWPEYIHVATGKNQKERVLRVAKNVHGALRLSGAVQSLSEEVLKNIKRNNIKADQLMELAQKARELGSNVYSESILAMPGDSVMSHIETNRILLDAGFQFIRNYPLMMLMGVEMSAAETREKFDMKTGYRVMSQCFGVYPFGNEEPIVSVEIEEICTSTKDLSFEEYLEMRLFHLAIEVFYNDSILVELFSFLNERGVKTSDFILNLFNGWRENFPPKLKDIFNSFRKETIEELFLSEDALQKSAKNTAAIAEYANGKHGSNMIYRFKAMAFMDAVDEIMQYAFFCARTIVNDELLYLHELEIFSIMKKHEFLDTDTVREGFFHFDFSNCGNAIQEGIWVRFFHTESQKAQINDLLRLYGNDPIGVSRVLSKQNVTKMLRTVETV
ncbi:MAG: cobalamin B12-binding domain-containing protein [Parcubacteria group bacterium Gr01-1014_17]|nr:MAG: cobalamin B12-binding domain-containing protein [Parcubacteria group bacterium Gr01-1014_17]